MIETELREDLPKVETRRDDVIESVVAPQKVRPRRRGLTANTKSALWIVMSIGLLALWLVSFARVFSGIEQQADQRGLYDTFRLQLAEATAPLGGVIPPGSPVALVDAPAARINGAIVVEGTSAEVTRAGPGHRRNTPLPGQAGSSVVYGRSISFGAPFGEIGRFVVGDSISVTTGQGVFEYEVEALRRPGDPSPVPLQAGEARLTLVTAEGSGWMQGWAAQQPLYVDALLVSEVADTPPGRLTQISQTEDLMSTSTASLMPLVLWLQLLLIVSIAWVWATRRWGTWPAWIVAVPVFATAAWGTTSAAFGLLPNVL